MGANSNIEWTDHTFNPWVGCTKVSPACDNCYAESWAKRAGRSDLWHGSAPQRTSEANWRKPIKWNADAAKAGKRARVFCASLADVFDNAVPGEWRSDLFALIRKTPHLDWLLLTKRIGNAWHMSQRALWSIGMHPGMHHSLPQNVWLGATVVTQAEVERDVPKLLATPARIHFLSCEPLLGQLDIDRFLWDEDSRADHLCGLDWVIAGGESGPGARPMNPDWARALRDQCAVAGVPFFFKQWGEWGPEIIPPVRDSYRWPITAGEPAGGMWSYRVGKKAAGRLLDNKNWETFP